jgi:hypothetical protein
MIATVRRLSNQIVVVQFSYRLIFGRRPVNFTGLLWVMSDVVMSHNRVLFQVNTVRKTDDENMWYHKSCNQCLCNYGKQQLEHTNTLS